MRGPGYAKDPEHTVEVRDADGEWVASHGGTELARTRSGLALYEDGYPPVIYFPREDVRLDALDRSDSKTYCPFKGEASYLAIDGQDVAWSYGVPYDEVQVIGCCIAFYADRVSLVQG
jgi:uncharacterized protein (DUF427 family)